MSERLEQARAYVETHCPPAEDPRLPLYHVNGGVGWINDPNGLSFYRGEYHLFFQYHPYAKYWGPMHWGHVKSRNLLRWERLPVALAPDEEYDSFGVFSGSGVETPEGRHLLMYTGVRTERDANGARFEVQNQCVAFGDGIDYVKAAENPVIGSEGLPPGGSDRDFRDPKLWREDGLYKAVAADRLSDGTGAVLLYESADALRWRLRGICAASRGHWGKMWECPDLFALDGETVLLVSAFELPETGLEFLAGNGVLCMIGELDKESGKLSARRVQALDYGLDFYASQSLLTPDGRRIMVGWMQHFDSTRHPPEELPFFGQLTVPRELSLREGRLYVNPIREIEGYRDEGVRYSDLPLCESLELPGVRGRCLDMTLTLRPGENLRRFTLQLAADGERFTAVSFDPAARTLTVDRSKSGYDAPILQTRTMEASPRNGELRLRLLLDRWSMELFLNDGEKAASFTLYTPQTAEGIRFLSEGGGNMDVEKYTLGF